MDEKCKQYLSEILDHNDEFIWSCSLDELMSKINHASRRVKRFLSLLFPTVDDLEEYLYQEEEFWVENSKVTLYYPGVENASDEAVRYFEDILDSYTERPYYKNFYGHIGQADEQVKTFMRLFYGGEFKQFLQNHPDVFVVYDDNTVALTENEAVNYFEELIQENRNGWFYMNLRGCIGQAPKFITKFINNCYPGKEFRQFLRNNSHIFYVNEDGYVYLNVESELESESESADSYSYYHF